MKWSEKTKKNWIFAGGLLVAVVLMAAIVVKMQKPQGKEDVLPREEASSVEIQVELPSEEAYEAEAMAEEVVSKEADGELLEEQTDLEEQKIQSDPARPEVSSEAFTDPTKTPDGTVQDTSPEAVEHDEVPSTEELRETVSETQRGETKEGQVYVPGFGWITDVGNAKGSTAQDMVENGNKIGIMD